MRILAAHLDRMQAVGVRSRNSAEAADWMHETEVLTRALAEVADWMCHRTVVRRMLAGAAELVPLAAAREDVWVTMGLPTGLRATRPLVARLHRATRHTWKRLRRARCSPCRGLS